MACAHLWQEARAGAMRSSLVNRPVYRRLAHIVRASNDAQMRGRVWLRGTARTASFRWQRKAEDWQAIAGLTTTAPLHRWAIHNAA